MLIWWESLTGLEQVLLYIAVPATLILLIQTILLFLGGVIGGDADADAGADGEVLDSGLDGRLDLGGEADGSTDLHDGCCHDGCLHDGALHDGEDPGGHAAAGLHVLTIRGVVAFLTLFGWGGLWLSQIGLRPFWALFLSVQMGIIGMVGIALLLREAVKLQQDGTLDLRNAVGCSGTVYLTVPAARAGSGKVNVIVQEQLCEFDAVTELDAPIPTGTEVAVVGLAGEAILVVPR